MTDATPNGSSSDFGHWDVEDGLPVFRETVLPDAAACRWDPLTAPVTHRHWCGVGNRRFQLVAENLGTVALWDTAHGHRWLTAAEPGTGATVVTATGRQSWATDRERWPASWADPAGAPVRTWGPTWFTVTGTHDGVRIERTVACPEGEVPWLLVRVALTADESREVEVAEEWHISPRSPARGMAPDRAHELTAGPVSFTSVPDQRGITLTEQRDLSLDAGHSDHVERPPVVGPELTIRVESNAPLDRVETDGERHPTVRLIRRLHLAPGDPSVCWFLLGLPDEQPPPADPERCWEDSLTALRDRLPAAGCDRVPQLAREVPWHVALLTGGASTDAVLGGHTLDQASAYSFHWGINAAARDPLQHALPLVYSEPDLALSVLRNTCSWAGPDGELPWALTAVKQPMTDWFQPSDQALWSLWLAAEYAAATGDLDAFRKPVGFHPDHRADPVPLVEHLVRQFRHLVDVVGTGARGHIRILNADWNDSALRLAGIDRTLMQAQGESVLNSAMAAWVLPRFAGLLRGLGDPELAPIADEAGKLADRWRDLVAGEWTGRWYRRAYGPGAAVGEDQLWLEVQPWAILSGAAGPERAQELLTTIHEVVRQGSPLGARLLGPVPLTLSGLRSAGEGTSGGIWFSINMTLAWAAAALDPELAWDELARMTLASHTTAYPSVWEGTLSGPDAYNTPESPRPGHTWAAPQQGIGMQSFPVNNLHAHAQVVFTYLRLLGVEPAADGSLHIDGRGGAFRSRVLDLPGDGHGTLHTTGAVRVVTPSGPVEGRGRVDW